MQRLALILAAVAATAFGPVAVSLAHAEQGRGRPSHQDRGWERQDRGGGRDWRPREMRRPDRGVYDERRAPPRGERGRGRWEDPGPYGRGYPGYPAPYPRAPGVRPGGYLPPDYRGAPLDDYRRYRLRPPPRGYHWVRVGDGFALVSPDGQIFDMVR